MKMECIDQITGIELWTDGEEYDVRFENDKRGGTSLLCAYHEQEVYDSDERREVPLDNYQVSQVEEWFFDYLAIK